RRSWRIPDAAPLVSSQARWLWAPACAGTTMDLFSRPDRHLQRADTVDAALDLVAGRQRGHAGGRAGHDDVAGIERYLLRELPDDFRHAPDQLGEVALLPLGAVDGEPDLSLRGMADLGGRLQRAAGRGMVEGL